VIREIIADRSRAAQTDHLRVVAQDCASSVVFGMACVAMKAELMDILPLDGIASWLAAQVDQR
jgi:chemotaxis response regulator CheB